MKTAEKTAEKVAEPERRRFRCLVCLALILAGVTVPSLVGAFPLHRTLSQVSLGVAGAAWLGALLSARRLPASTLSRAWILGGALALRLVVATGDPALSDDVHRYVWEGGLVSEGVSPYAWAPDAPELAEQRTRWSGVYGRMNNTGISAAYPPLAQLVFSGVVLAAGGPEAEDGARAVSLMRLAFTFFDVCVLWVLLEYLRSRGAPEAMAVVWGWSPLVALEFAGSAHFDSLGILLLLMAVVFFERSASCSTPRGSPGIVLLGLGMLVKLLPVASVPFAVRLQSGRRVRALLLLGFVLGLGYLPLALLEGGLGGVAQGLSQYALRWESFSLLFRVIAKPIAWVFPEPGGLWAAGTVARGCVGLLWIGVGWTAWRRRAGMLEATCLMIAAFLLLTPTLHPWYLTWLLPFLALRPSLAWCVLAALAPLLYWPLTEWQARAEWIEPVWLWPLVALPFLLLLAREPRAASVSTRRD